MLALTEGESLSTSISQDTVAKFNAWYDTEIAKSSAPDWSDTPAAHTGTASNRPPEVAPQVKTEPDTTGAETTAASDATPSGAVPASSSSSSSSVTSSSSPPHPPQPSKPLPVKQASKKSPTAARFTPILSSASSSHTSSGKTRVRTSFDPEHELPRLQRWFRENSRPSREQMVRYTALLNSLECRAGRRPLDPNNIVYWFKNARAAHRRSAKTPAEGEAPQGCEPLLVPPVLPNKNAVYVVPYPYHTSQPPAAAHEGVGEEAGYEDEPCDLSMKKKEPRETSPPRPAERDARSGGGVASGVHGRNNGIHAEKLDVSLVHPKAHSRTVDGDCTLTSSLPSRDAARPHWKEPPSRDPDSEASMRLPCHHRHQQHLIHDQRKDAADREARYRSPTPDLPPYPYPQPGEEADYPASVRREMGLDLGGLAVPREASAVSMAALSLAQLSQQQQQLAARHLSPLHPLAVYGSYYHQGPGQAAPSWAAVMAAYTASSPHLHGQGSNGCSPPSSATPSSSSSSPGTPQSPAAARAPPVLPHPEPDPYPHPHPHPHPQPRAHPNPHPHPHPHPHPRPGESRKRRTRIFIDPVTEIPKLEEWFLLDTHPSAYMIDKFTELLNAGDYRRKFPKLEAKNIQLWFKNHRAKVKRLRTSDAGEGGGEEENEGEGEGEQRPGLLLQGDRLPTVPGEGESGDRKDGEGPEGKGEGGVCELGEEEEEEEEEGEEEKRLYIDVKQDSRLCEGRADTERSSYRSDRDITSLALDGSNVDDGGDDDEEMMEERQ